MLGILLFIVIATALPFAVTGLLCWVLPELVDQFKRCFK